MTKLTTQAIQALVRTDQVHGCVYTDPELFQLEVERIFARAWNYVGHASQIPHKGDYFTTAVANQPVIMIRHTDDDIRVLRNRCAHRGAEVVGRRCGQAKTLRCCYHGWTYRTDGTLLAIPQADGYAGTEVAADKPQFSMTPLRTATYRGFVFATLATNGPDLDEFLGETKRGIDNMVDRAPDGELEVAANCFRTVQRNNWKIYLENLHDGMHPQAVHQSSIAASAALLDSQDAVSLPVTLVHGNAQSYQQLAALRVNCYAKGHSDMRGFRDPGGTDPVFDEYAAGLAGKVGQSRCAEILADNVHNVCVYPNASAHPGFLQMRVLHPVAVDRTVVEIWVLRLKGAPEKLNQRNVVFANTVHSPSSLIKPDDLEAYERVQRGLAAGSKWVSLHREFDAGMPAEPAPSSALSEQFIRNQYGAWLAYMMDES